MAPLAPSPLLLDLPETLETPRLLLRSPLPGDGPATNEAIVESWEQVHRWLPWAQALPTVAQSEEMARQKRAEFIARTNLPMLVLPRDRPGIVGSSGLHSMDWSVPRFEIGYWIRKSCQRQGYATEVVRTLTRFAFGTLAAERVEIHCSHRNEASQGVALKCGFALEGRLRNHSREPTGELRDTLIYALVRQDAAVQALPAAT